MTRSTALREPSAGASGTSAPRRVLVVDPLDADALEVLAAEHELSVQIGLSQEELRAQLADAEVLVMRSGVRLGAAEIAAAPRLVLVARAGVGFDNIDLDAARRAGITVFNVPGGSANAVAEHALGLALAVMRRVALADAQTRRGQWRKPELVGDELSGGIMGIVGLGAIGSRLAELAVALGMRVLGTVARPNDERRRHLARCGVELVQLTELLRESSVVCLAVPLDERTRGMIGTAELSAMRPAGYLVNVARGGVVDEEALYEALRVRRLAGAALDVVDVPGGRNRLADLDNVVITPHIGAMTAQSQARVGRIVTASIALALRGEPVDNRLC